MYAAIAADPNNDTNTWKAVREAEKHARFLRVQVVGEGSLKDRELRVQKPNYMAISTRSPDPESRR